MCQRISEGGRRCISHHSGTRVALALARVTHPELSPEQQKDIVRRLYRHATSAGMRQQVANHDQVDALLNKMELELESFPFRDSSYRTHCQKRLAKFREDFNADPSSVSKAQLFVWRYLSTAAGHEVTRRHRANPKRIGVDMDGVVYDCHAVMNQFMTARGYPRPTEAMTEYDLSKYWNVEPSVIQQEFRNAVECGLMFRHGEPLEDGKAALKALYEDGHHIVLITARDLPGLTPECREATLLWAMDSGIPFDELHLTGEKEKIDVDVLLDDAPGNVDRVVGHGMEGVLIDRPFNRLEGHGHTRRNWVDVVRELNQPDPEDVLFTLEPDLSDSAVDRVIPLGLGSDAPAAKTA